MKKTIILDQLNFKYTYFNFLKQNTPQLKVCVTKKSK